MTRPHPVISPRRISAVSASQVKAFELCPRRWGWDKLANVPRGPEKLSTAGGTAMHAVAEAYLRDGTKPDVDAIFTMETGPDKGKSIKPGAIFEAGRHLNPLPKSGTVEGKLNLRNRVGAYFGYIDWHGIDPDGEVCVQDHKSTSNFRYALGEDDLPKDKQAVLYAAWAMMHYHVDRVRLRWIYYLTKGKPRAKKVERVVTKDDVSETLGEIDRIAGIIWEAYHRKLHPLDLPPSFPEGCDAFGGCEYRHLCNLTPKEKLDAAMSNPAPAPPNLDALLAEHGITPAAPAPVGDGPPPPAPPAAPPPAPPAPPADGHGSAINDGSATPTPDAPEPRADKPPPAPVSRPAADASRKEVKAYGVQIGAFPSSASHGLAKLWEMIGAVDAPPAPAAPCVPHPKDHTMGSPQLVEGYVSGAPADYPDAVQVSARRLIGALEDFLDALTAPTP